MRDVDKVFEL